MSIYAVVADGEVINTIEWDGSSEYESEVGTLIKIPDDINAGVGWSFDGKVFTPPPGFVIPNIEV